MDRFLLIPELNYWITNILHNNPINDKFTKVPIPTADAIGRCYGSVLELLFNDCFTSNISSRSKLIQNNKAVPVYYFFNDNPEIVNLESINNTEEVSSSSSQESEPSSSSSYEEETYSSSSWLCNYAGKFEILYKGIEREKITDKNILQRTTVAISNTDVMVCYVISNNIYFNPSNDIHHYVPTDIFNFTQEELYMLCKLYDYKTNQTVSISNLNFNWFESSLSKSIYIYLDWEINESLEYFKSDVDFSKDSDLLRLLYEKYVYKHIYKVLSFKYNISYKVQNIDIFTELNYDFIRVVLTEQNVLIKSYTIVTDEKPYYARSSILLYNGISKVYGSDYELVTDITGEISITWKHNLFTAGNEIYFLWSFLDS
jgi:hypothetical protein